MTQQMLQYSIIVSATRYTKATAVMKSCTQNTVYLFKNGGVDLKSWKTEMKVKLR